MFLTSRHPRPLKLVAGAITLAAHMLLAAMLLLALTQANRSVPTRQAPVFVITQVTPPPPPPPHQSTPRKIVRHKAVAAAAPAPAPLAAPPPEVIPSIALPSPVIGPLPAAGGGAGGTGTGGNGSGGTGEGGDGTGGGGTPPVQIGGRITDRDYPRALSDIGISGTVSVRYRVGVDGRVTDCLITHSSGHEELDTLTCRLIERRFRYRPSRDEEGRPVPSTIVENHSWIIPPPTPAEAAQEHMDKPPYLQR